MAWNGWIPFFCRGREVGPDGAELLGPGLCAETADDLEEGFRRADIPLSLVVGPGHLGVMEIAERGRLVMMQAIEQCECFAAYRGSPEKAWKRLFDWTPRCRLKPFVEA